MTNRTHTTNPVSIAFGIPDWRMNIRDYAAIEVHPCKVVKNALGGVASLAICEPSRSCLWPVCGRNQDGSLHSFDQYPTPNPARRFAQKLGEAYPHFKEQSDR